MATKKKMLQAAAGSATGGGPLDITDVFSTYLYEGNGGTKTITNGIDLGDGNTSGSAQFTSSGPDDLVVAYNSDFTFSGDFTVELFAYFDGSIGTSEGFLLEIGDYTDGIMLAAYSNADTVYASPATAVNLGDIRPYLSNKTWHHIAIVRSGSSVNVYVDGTSRLSGTSSGTINASGQVIIAGSNHASYTFDGSISNVRIVNGTAVYTSNFTPLTSELTAITNTVLLTCQGADPFVDNSSNAFTITKNGSPESVTLGPFSGAGTGEGGLVWLKMRDTSTFTSRQYHFLYDTERGAGKRLSTNLIDAEAAYESLELNPFNSNGFSLGSSARINESTKDYASWTFRKAPKFFDVVTWTGDGTTGRTVSHNLGVKPAFMMVKKTSGSKMWCTYHKDLGATKYMAFDAGAASESIVIWNNTEPTTTEFTVGYTGFDYTNGSGDTYVAYLFAHNDGDGEFGPDGDQDIIKCGSYTGNGGENPINLGWEPQWLLVKCASNDGGSDPANWWIIDNMRGWEADADLNYLEANTSSAELPRDRIRLTATGFTPNVPYTPWNASGQEYIYIAIRRGPLAPPESGTEVFGMDDYGTGGDGPVTGFVTDFSLLRYRNQNDNWHAVTRLCGESYLKVQETTAETNNGNAVSDRMDGMWNTAVPNYFLWGWKRAPGYFDAVAYSGNGVAGRTVSHNLGVAPEMVWVKARDVNYSWYVYHKDLGATKFLELDGSGAASTGTLWTSTPFTDSAFYLNGAGAVNGSGNDYISYLFSSLDGISKVGSFSHTSGTPTDVDCGFTAGARFVLWKKTSNTDGWQVYDTTRGITSGNDPFLQLNSTVAEITNEDLIDPLSTGFTVSANKNSGDYIFYAIA